MHLIFKGQQCGVVSYTKVPAQMKSSAMCDLVANHLQHKPAWDIIDDKDDVMVRLLICNKLHLHQVWDNPCVSSPIKEYLGEYGICRGAKDTIEGNLI
eukprot:824368-Ditylum_brightwellii.AAC.1